MARNNLKVLLADDHRILREGLRALLEREADIEVVAEASNGGEAVQLAREFLPDVVVMDIGMPDLNGVDATREIMSGSAPPRVLCLSVHREPGLIQAMLEAGAGGYLLKTTAGRELIRAVRTVAAGETYLSPPVASEVVKRHVHVPGGPSARQMDNLTPRERDVLKLIARGDHTKRIADRLGISPKTVLVHRQNMMKKLGIDSLAGLVRYALKEGVSEL